jgi:DinB family protein
MLARIMGVGWRTTRVPAALRTDAADSVSLKQLASLVEQFRRITRDAEGLVANRTNSELLKNLDPTSWSVAECFDHLNQTTLAFLPEIAKTVAAAPRLTTNRSLRTGLITRIFIRNLEPPYRLRFRVLPQLTPERKDFQTVWRGFLQSQSKLCETILASSGLAIDRVSIQSPVYARVSYTIYGAFCMLAAHQRRHLWQVRQILRAMEQQTGIADLQ